MGSMQFSAQYQQAPEPAGGKIIKRKMLKYYSSVERRPTDRIVMSWDIALSEQEGRRFILPASFCSTVAIRIMCMRSSGASFPSTD